MEIKLKDSIGFDPNLGFAIGGDRGGHKVEASVSANDVDALLAKVYASGNREEHELVAAQIVEPIEQVVPYIEIYSPVFFQDVTYGELEDNSIPVENTVALAFETHQDAQVLYVKAGFSWTRPTFTTYDAGIEVSWEMMKKAGWNYLARQMRRTTEALARKRDALAKTALVAAIPVGSDYTVSGGLLTKTSVDTVLKAKAQIGFPVRRVLINPGRLMDMFNSTAWAWPSGFFTPPEMAKSLLTNLFIGDYGGAQWYTNPFVPVNEVYFGGEPSQIGWRQLRGSVKSASDVNITKKIDLHAIYDQEYAFYVGNSYTLARITVTP